MHKLATTPITIDCFEVENLDLIVASGGSIDGEWELIYSDYWEDVITQCENLRQKYLGTKDKRYWKALIQILPESWLQTRTITMNYEIAMNIIKQRTGHKLTEWQYIIDKLKDLPYMKEFLKVIE